jgi:hypothetical protein
LFPRVELLEDGGTFKRWGLLGRFGMASKRIVKLWSSVFLWLCLLAVK